MALMPQHYETSFTVHPTTLDGLLQCGSYIPFLDETNASVGGASNVWVPNAVEKVTIRIGSGEVQKPGVILRTMAWTEHPTQKMGSIYSIDAMVDGATDSQVQIRGLELGVEKALAPQWPAPHYGCYKLDWQATGELQAEPAQWHILQGPGDDSNFAGAISKEIGATVVPVCEGLPSEARFCIVVDVGEGLLGSLGQTTFDHVKHALTTCEGVLWVTRGALGASYNSTKPTAGMVVGLLRTIRSEMQASLASLDLDAAVSSEVGEQAALVKRVAGHVVAAARKADAQAGAIILPRHCGGVMKAPV
jgi:hypothetical protein